MRLNEMKTNSENKALVYCILSVALSLVPLLFLYLTDVHDKNPFTIIIKNLSRII